ncbi:hypothetical protein J1N35_029143 [Gossypium stocksii]|uniref:Uncharacterized protein n=1 Tax=Gossypium stocksii TaxID=47602 RepID=A0A9D3UXA0_9ROSI|nr:hypothetical protein J1N35_029143 [Gossypium stocksii]
MRKNRRTNIEVANVVVSSKVEEDSVILEQHQKKRTDHAEPFAIVVTTSVSPIVSSPSVAHVSSLVFAHISSSLDVPSNSPSTYTPSYPPTTKGPSNESIFGTIVEDGVAGAAIKFVGMGV